MIRSDFHVHSEFSTDSDAKFEEQIESAIGKGIEHLCFTDHMDIDFPSAPDCDAAAGGPEFQVDMPSYRAMYEKCRNIYCPKDLGGSGTLPACQHDNAGINMYFGIELGLKTDITDKLNKFISENRFDFIIGSIHVVDNIDVYEPEYFEGHDEIERYRHYFDVTLENIKKFHDFDVLGHLDYISRKGKLRDSYTYEQFSDIIDEILKTLIQNGNGIEINTGSYKSGLLRPNPCLSIVKRYKELGGEIITVGSDAHSPAYIASHFPDAEAVLCSAGFSHYCIFKNRSPKFLSL